MHLIATARVYLSAGVMSPPIPVMSSRCQTQQHMLLIWLLQMCKSFSVSYQRQMVHPNLRLARGERGKGETPHCDTRQLGAKGSHFPLRK